MDLTVNNTVTIFRKTAKGFTEIETRANRLPLRQRSVLIIVDGRSPDRDLRKLAGPHVDAMLKELLEGGYIEPVSSYEVRPAPFRSGSGFAEAGHSVPASVPGGSQAQPSAQAGPSPSPHDLAALRRDAVRALTDQVGPMAESLAIKIEAARTWGDLKPLLVIAQQIIANVRGRSAADAWKQRFIGP